MSLHWCSQPPSFAVNAFARLSSGMRSKPDSVMTTFPANALLGRVSLSQIGGAALGATLALGISRLVWTRAMSRYTSASS